MIKLFLSDCDGTLTNGIYQTTEKGDISKGFFTRDFHGMWMLYDVGVKIGIITAAGDDVIVHQCRKGAKYAKIHRRVQNKNGFVMANYIDDGLFSWDEVSYIGDDVFDMELMKSVGLCACPLDADSEVLKFVGNRSNGFCSNFSGGKGCVREFAEYVLAINEVERKQ